MIDQAGDTRLKPSYDYVIVGASAAGCWVQAGAEGWAFKDVLPIYKAQEDWQESANTWRGTGGPFWVRTR